MIGRGSRGPVVMSLASASRGSGFWRLQFSRDIFLQSECSGQVRPSSALYTPTRQLRSASDTRIVANYLHVNTKTSWR